MSKNKNIKDALVYEIEKDIEKMTKLIEELAKMKVRMKGYKEAIKLLED